MECVVPTGRHPRIANFFSALREVCREIRSSIEPVFSTTETLLLRLFLAYLLVEKFGKFTH